VNGTDPIYVGGAIGHVPIVVTDSLRHALRKTLECYVFHGDEDLYAEKWVCEFVDGEPDGPIRWTLRIAINGEAYVLYVETFDACDVHETRLLDHVSG
jgi:hypothetical protein